MKIKSLLLIGSMAVFGMAMTSCSKEENLFDNQAAQAEMFSKYSANFVKKYGPVDPNQTWDFATMSPVYLPKSSTGSVTRGASDIAVTRSDGEIIINKEVLDYMHTNMTAGEDNSTKGESFTFETPGNDFIVVPIYQGVASYRWELWVNIGGVETKIWSKGENISYRTSAESSTWKKPDNNGVPDGAYEVKAPTTKFSSASGIEMYFFLKVFGGNNPAGGTKITSLQPMKMIALEGAPIPSSVPKDYTATIIGCEDGADTDFEDLVFMVYGKPVPTIKRHEDVDVLEAKRYLIEDLGGADDFDFNDIVIDLQRYSTVRNKWAGQEGNLQYVGQEILDEGQRAIIRAAGGTHEFTVKIGGREIWKKGSKFDVTEMLNTGWNKTAIDWNAELAVIELGAHEWDAQKNNIEIVVEGSNGIRVVSFPNRGDVPLVISTDPSALGEWMTERTDIPKDWTVWE